MNNLKKCTGCGEAKPPIEFAYRNKAKGLRHKRCRECQKAPKRAWYSRNRDTHRKQARIRANAHKKALKEWLDQYKSGHPCVDCGEADPVVLQFDHVRDEKDRSLSDLIHRGVSVERLQREIAKCEVRCANCHIRRHHKSRLRDGGQCG